MTRANSGSGESDFELARLISRSTFPSPGTEKAMPGSTLPRQRSAGAIPESALEQQGLENCITPSQVDRIAKVRLGFDIRLRVNGGLVFIFLTPFS